jgi:GNAT superfamily N-acetyltransferase
MLMASSHLKDVMGPAVEANGMVAGRDDPGMLLEPIPSRPAGSSTVTVRHVTTLEGLQDFQDVAAGIFFPMSTLKRMFPSIPDREGSGEGGPQLFVCYDNGKPVATSMLLVSLGLGGIFFVGTREEARKRGYGTAATWAAVLAARQEGCDACFLTASDVGLPIYERMGFRKVLKYLQWHTPGPKDG